MRSVGTAAVALLVVVLSGCAGQGEVQVSADGLDCDRRVTSSSSWDESGPPTFGTPDDAVRDRLGLGDDALLQVGDVTSEEGVDEVDVLVHLDGRKQASVRVRHGEDGWYADSVTECA